MSLVRYAVLGLLARAPQSGYDLVRRSKEHISPLWPINYGQIYPELARLAAEGLIEQQAVERQDYRPEKKVYAVTPAGHEALRHWVTAPTAMQAPHDEFMLKVHNLWLVQPPEALGQLRGYRQTQCDWLRDLEQFHTVIEQRGTGSHTRITDPLFATMCVLRWGIQRTRAQIAWCDEVIAMIEAEQ